MQVRLEKPARRHEARLLAAVRRSHALHRGLISPPNTPEKYRQYVRDLRKVNRNGFFILTAEGSDIVGVVNINEIVRGLFQSAYLGYYALLPYAGKGLMREGFALALDHFFSVDKLNYIVWKRIFSLPTSVRFLWFEALASGWKVTRRVTSRYLDGGETTKGGRFFQRSGGVKAFEKALARTKSKRPTSEARG